MVAAASTIPLVPADEQVRRTRRQESALTQVWDLLDSVKDPEVPALSLWDLGVLQDVRQTSGGIIVTITPTYSGCPAMEAMREDIVACLESHGFNKVVVETRLSPAWTTDWLSEKAKEQLRQYGISPPVADVGRISCPQCGSTSTRLISEFGSTACKALYTCGDCQEPFDYFKSI